MIKHAKRVYLELSKDCRFQEASYFVDGQNGAQLFLSSEWERGLYPKIKTWKQVASGASVCVGSVGGEELRYVFFFAWLSEHLVGFYETERLLGDMKLIEAWLNRTPAGKKNQGCNAINFHSCVLAVS